MIRSLQKALNPQTLRGNLLFKLLIVLLTFQHASLTPDVSSCTSITSGKFWQHKLIKGWKHSFICEQHQLLDNRKHQQTFLHQSQNEQSCCLHLQTAPHAEPQTPLRTGKSLHCYFSTDHHWKYYDWLIMKSFFLQTTNILDIKCFCKQQLKLPGTSDFNTNKCMNPVSAAIFYIQAIDSLQWK